VTPKPQYGTTQKALADALDVAIWLSALVGNPDGASSRDAAETWQNVMRPKLFAALDVSNPASSPRRGEEMGSAGICGLHGMYQGNVCPKCAADLNLPNPARQPETHGERMRRVVASQPYGTNHPRGEQNQESKP
jgi:hypothetical protein